LKATATAAEKSDSSWDEESGSSSTNKRTKKAQASANGQSAAALIARCTRLDLGAAFNFKSSYFTFCERESPPFV